MKPPHNLLNIVLAVVAGVALVLYLCPPQSLLLGMGKVPTTMDKMGLAGACPKCPQLSSLENDNEAARILYVWQASLLQRAAAIYNNETRAKNPTSPNGKKWRAEAEEPQGHARFDLFNPFVDCPPGTKLERVGPAADGGKMVCGIGALKAPCTVYSLGSNRDTRFEEDVLKKTPCNVVTFDCTVDIQPLSARHRFEKMCIGSAEKAKEDPKRFETLENSVKRLGISEISLLKMDIEGYEYDVMSSWTRDMRAYLPRQISFELHFADLYYGTSVYKKDLMAGVVYWPRRNVALGELALLGYHLSNLGYGIVSREDNVQCNHCSELTLLRIA